MMADFVKFPFLALITPMANIINVQTSRAQYFIKKLAGPPTISNLRL